MKLNTILITISIMLSLFLTANATVEVKNEDKPLKSQWDFKAQKIWEITNAGSEIFYSIGNLCSDEKGTLFVADLKINKIHIFDSKGKLLNSFGKKGEGPGEIKDFRGFFYTGGYLVIPDKPKIHYFSTTGKYLKSAVIPNEVHPRIFIDENTFISYPRINYKAQKGESKAIVYNIADKSRKLLLEFSTYKKAVVRKTSGRSSTSYSFSSSYLTPLLRVDYHDNKFYRAWSNHYKIQVTDIEGKELLCFSLDRKKREVPGDFKKKLLENIDFPDHVKKTILKGFPDYFNFVDGFHIDDQGLITVFATTPVLKNVLRMDIFSPTGTYLYRTEIKMESDESIESFHFTEDRLYVAVENGDEEIKIVKYTITRPTLE
ncbi:MAG: 6-bladed beta-propeller [bacterium]|nr:6-bladed beta-propeller [bacterium]